MTIKPTRLYEYKGNLARLVDPHKSNFLSHRPSLLILGISLLITLVTFLKMRELEYVRLQNEFEQISKNMVATIKDSIDNNLQVLTELNGFYSASKKIDRSEFKEFAGYIFKRRSDIYMLGWSPHVKKTELDALRASVVADGLSDFTIKQYDHRGRMVPAQNREDYYPVLFVEPLETNRSMLGLDQASYKITSAAMQKTKETGAPASTFIMALPQFENEPPASRFGFQVFEPIFEARSIDESLTGREKNVLGYVMVAFHVRRLVESILKNINTPELELRIFADAVREKNKLIYTYNSQSTSNLKNSWTAKSEIYVAGHAWTVVCSSTPLFQKNHYRWEAPVVFGVGILLGFLLALYVFSFERKRIREIMVALSLTDELTKIYNRRGFWLLADEQIKLSLRAKRGFWLLMLDLDHLKQINDTLGHPEGDRAISHAAQLIKAAFRDSDIVARIGGDEFAVIAIDSERRSLPILTEHLQNQMKKSNSRRDHFPGVTMSTGAAFFDPANPCSFDQLLEQADKDLYAQKRASASPAKGSQATP